MPIYDKDKFRIEWGIGGRVFRAYALFDIRADSDCFDNDHRDYIDLQAGVLANLILNASKRWDISTKEFLRLSLAYLPHINTYTRGSVRIGYGRRGQLNFVTWEDKQNQINHSIRLQAGYHKKFRRIILGLDVRYYHGFNPIIRADFAFGDDWFCEAEFGTYELKDDFLAIGLSIQLARSELASDND